MLQLIKNEITEALIDRDYKENVEIENKVYTNFKKEIAYANLVSINNKQQVFEMANEAIDKYEKVIDVSSKFDEQRKSLKMITFEDCVAKFNFS